MNFVIQIDKQGDRLPPGQPGICRQTCIVHVAREARAPPEAGANTVKAVRNNNARVTTR
jgi:hypothetical protein